MEAQAEQVISELYMGLTLRRALDKHGVNPAMFFDVLSKSSDLQMKYDRARSIKADLMVDEMLEISDDETLDIGRAHNMLQARKFVASRYNPKLYGERVDVTVTKTVDISVALEDARKRLEVIEADAKKIEPVLIPKGEINESVNE